MENRRSVKKTPKALDANIEEIAQLREEHKKQRTFSSKAAEDLGEFFGSLASVYVHAFALAAWLLINTGVVPIVSVFDPPPFNFLNVFACVEAIFLSMFVLIRQNRTVASSEKRSELDLQMSLLTESEITRLIKLTDLIAKKMGVDGESEIGGIEETKADVNPRDVVERIEQSIDH